MSLVEKTGWTYDYLLWEISWINLKMMQADAPGVKREKVKKVNGDQLAKILGMQ